MESSTSLDQSPNTQSTNGLDEINYLIQLEAYKRFKDEEAHLRRMVDEKTRQYNEIKSEYITIYAKYVEILKLCATWETLQAVCFQDDNEMDKAAESIKNIARKTSIEKQVEFLRNYILHQAKDILAKTVDYKNLPELRHSTANNKSRVDFIQSSLARVETILETSIVSGLDSFIKRIED